MIQASLPTLGAIGPLLPVLFLAATGHSILATGVLPRWTGWLAFGAALLSAGFAPAIYGGKDLLAAVVAGGSASAGVYSYVSSLAGLTYLVWLLGAAVSLLAAGPCRRRSQPSDSSLGQ